mmetsp:Transcript_47901/g.117376  ORF Transcript_47901/g.117376 Transcript_47901/m.117376 type:complete len:124 (-) Transcript_47901:158-529(-)
METTFSFSLAEVFENISSDGTTRFAVVPSEVFFLMIPRTRFFWTIFASRSCMAFSNRLNVIFGRVLDTSGIRWTSVDQPDAGSLNNDTTLGSNQILRLQLLAAGCFNNATCVRKNLIKSPLRD